MAAAESMQNRRVHARQAAATAHTRKAEGPMLPGRVAAKMLQTRGMNAWQWLAMPGMAPPHLQQSCA